MTKKLTKAQWFEAAKYWHCSATGDDGSPLSAEFIEKAGDNAVNETGGFANGNTPDNAADRWFMYSQFCLEKAGL